MRTVLRVNERRSLARPTCLVEVVPDSCPQELVRDETIGRHVILAARGTHVVLRGQQRVAYTCRNKTMVLTTPCKFLTHVSQVALPITRQQNSQHPE